MAIRVVVVVWVRAGGLVTPVLAVFLVFFRASFADFAFVLQGDEIASVLLDLVTIGAAIGAAVATVTNCKRSGGQSCQQRKDQSSLAHDEPRLFHLKSPFNAGRKVPKTRSKSGEVTPKRSFGVL